MTAYEKPQLNIVDVERVIKEHFGASEEKLGLATLEGGNLSSVYAFTHNAKGYVIKFSDMKDAYAAERYVSHLLSSQGVPFPRTVGYGQLNGLEYSIMEKVEGGHLVACTQEQKLVMLPELISVVTTMNHVNISGTTDYGWIKADGNGSYPTWRDYLIGIFAEDQTGTFWEGWYELFDTTVLEKDVFTECYERLLAYAKYSEPHRYFIHGDLHAWNILSDGSRITGIIDGNCAYGDFLVDVADLDRSMWKIDIPRAYLEHQERIGVDVPHFQERLIGGYYYKGLIGLQFYAKMGRNDDYYATREFLLSLTN